MFRLSVYNPIGLILLATLPRLHPREGEGVAHVLGAGALQIVGVALQAKFFAYHYGGLLPLLGLLAGWGVWKLWIRIRRHVAYVALFVVVAYLLHDVRTATVHSRDGFWERCALRWEVLTHPERRSAVHDRLYSVGDVNAVANAMAAQWLRENTSEGSDLLIWGFEPTIHVAADRRPASRFFYNIPLRLPWSEEKARAILLDELHGDPPNAIVVVRRDRMPDVFRDRQDSREALEGFPELRRLIETEYRRAAEIEDLTIYLRNPPAGPGG